MAAGAVAALAPACAPAAMAADGDIYTGFSGDGKLLTNFGSEFGLDDPEDAALDSSGRIVVVGRADGEIGVARINPDGTPDSTFGGGDGKVILDSGTADGGERAQEVAVAPDGKIVIAGYAQLAGGNTNLVLARLETDGDLDPTFVGPPGSVPSNGIFRLNLADSEYAAGLAFKGTKIVIGATGYLPDATAAVLQLNDNGSLDTLGFGGDGDGIVTFSFPGTGPGSIVFAIAVQPDGMIVASGRAANSANGFSVARIKADGSGLDTAGFNASGTPGVNKAPAPPGYIGANASDVLVDGGGNIVVGGDVQGNFASNFDYDAGVARFTPAGALDPIFGTDGQTVVDAPNQQFGGGIALQQDGSILLGGGTESTPGTFIYDGLAARFTTAGVLDSTFGTAGLATTAFGQDTRPDTVLFDEDKGVAYLVGSSDSSAPVFNIGVAALKAGIPDPPTFLSSVPTSPGDSLEPRLQGSVQNDADEVWIFDNDQCTGTPVAEGSPAEFNSAGIPVEVEPGSDNLFWAVAIKEVFTSDCSSVLSSGGSIAYDVIPSAPSITSSDPATGANDNTPKLIGTAREDANTVLIFTGAGCSGAQAAEGPAGAFTSTGFEVSVADNTTTTFYARAVGDNGTSACSATGFSYTEATPGVTPAPTPSAGPTGQRANALKKCAKIKKKAKKKKCKARARKLPI
jgi:uncharacterized delta-60 repeat protein